MTDCIQMPQVKRCVNCGETDAATPGVYACGSTDDKQTAWCRKVVEQSKVKKPRAPAVVGCPVSPLRRDIEALEVGQSRLYQGKASHTLEYLQSLVNKAAVGKRMVVRKTAAGRIVHIVPEIGNMEIGESVRYSDNIVLVTRWVFARNVAYNDGVEGCAYSFDLRDGYYFVTRVL